MPTPPAVRRLLSAVKSAAVDPGDGLAVRPSPIDGLGLFVTRAFPAGAVIDATALRRDGEKSGGVRYEESDAARYTNHSVAPSAHLRAEGDGVSLLAARDLKPGDEVTVDYYKIADALDKPFTLWYRGRPYTGESTPGKGRVKAAMFGGLADAAAGTIVAPVIGGLAARHGLVYAPGQGDLVDRMDTLREQQEAFKATGQAADADQATYRRLFGGVAQAAGVDPTKPAVGKAIDRMGRDVAGVSPYLRAYFPGVWERLHGWRGSAANLAAKLHQTAAGLRDPVTGRRGQSADATAAQATGVFDRLYGPQARQAQTAGLSAAQIGDLDAAGQARGLLGSQTPLSATAHADRLGALARPAAAVRDLLVLHGPKQAAVHALVGRRHVGGREVAVCPHCDRPLRVGDLYRDSKGWLFHRPCLVKGKGPIRLTTKQAFDAPGAVDVLEKLTQGQLPNLDPEGVAVDVRRLNELAKTTPGGLSRLFDMLGHGGEQAEADGMPRVMATKALPGAAGFSGAYNRLAGGQGFAGLVPDEAAALDQKLRLAAAGSPMANMMAATVALEDAGLLRPGTPAALAADAFRRGAATLPDGRNVGTLTAPQWVEMMTASGVSQPAAWEQLRARDANREYAFKHNLGDSVRQAQGAVEVRPLVRNFLGQGLLPTLHAAGVDGTTAFDAVGAMSGTLENALHHMPAEVLTGDRRQLVGALSQQVTAAHPDWAARLGPQGMAEAVHTAVSGVDQAVRSDPRLTQYRNLTGLLTAHRPDILRAGGAAVHDATQEAHVRDSTAHLGQQDWLQRLSDAAQTTTAETPFLENVAKGFGAVPGQQVAEAVHAVPPPTPPPALAGQSPELDAAAAARRGQLTLPQPQGTPGATLKNSPYLPGPKFGKKGSYLHSAAIRRIFPRLTGTHSSSEETVMTKQATRTVGPYTAVIDRPKGFKKVFPTPAGDKTVPYPVDYGYLHGLINPDDNEDLDVFFGSGGPHYGRFMKGQNLTGEWKPDERKWYHGLTDEELKAVHIMFDTQSPGLLRDHTRFDDEAAMLADAVGAAKKATVAVNDDIYMAPYDPTEFELPEGE